MRGVDRVGAGGGASATTTRANYWNADGFGPAAQAVHIPSSTGFDVGFILGDHLSTTRGLTDSAGAVSLLSYAPFGDLVSEASCLYVANQKRRKAAIEDRSPVLFGGHFNFGRGAG